MICDRLEDIHRFITLPEPLSRAVQWLSDPFLVDQADGRYEIDGDSSFALIQRYITRPAAQALFESHRKYIDVQYVVNGTEKIYLAHTAGLRIKTAYDESIDRILYELTGLEDVLMMNAGKVAVFFPHDAHMPCLHVDGPASVHKVVIKVQVPE